ncbi:MAG: hypothetical protein C0490_28995, partial [Marivirga sp.]|nr:hypothetical protein [Marivirga sp.]
GKVYIKKGIGTKDRGLWTTASIDANNTILINTKNSQHTGALIRMSSSGEIDWKVEYGKALSVPVVDNEGHIFTATWNGNYLKYKS